MFFESEFMKFLLYHLLNFFLLVLFDNCPNCDMVKFM